MNVAQALRDAQRLLAAHSDSARLDAELLLGAQLGWNRAQLFSRGDAPLSPEDASVFEANLQRRIDGEPVAYLTGRQGFWSLDLQVSADVLVPRPETELLVEWALQLASAEAPRIADLGTGSGALALALKASKPQAQLSASDVSTAALRIARGNAQRLQLAVEFREGSWWQAYAGDERFDLAVSNPPYIARDDAHLPALRHEPLLALSDGADGLQALREIISGAPAHLRRGGWLLVEHGWQQGEAVRALFVAAGFAQVETRRDLEQRERATGGCLA